MMMWWDGGGWGWLAMSISMMVFWGLIIWGVLIALRGARTDPAGGARSPDPEQILEERFARGEIDAQEYEQRRDLLRR
jgi:putative membrane protein